MKTQRRCFITQFTIYCLSKLIKFKFFIIDEGPFTILQTVGRFRSNCVQNLLLFLTSRFMAEIDPLRNLQLCIRTQGH